MKSLPAWLDKKTFFILDLDGVVYEGPNAVDGSVEAISMLRASGKRVVFLTNNSAKKPESVFTKLSSIGVQVDLGDIVTSGLATAWWLKQEGLNNAYVSGTSELRELLADHGIATCSKSQDADAVVVGMDPLFSYQSIVDCLPGLLRKIPFIACNIDAYYPVGQDRYLPGCGAMVGALEGACGRPVDLVIGKPNTYILKMVCSQFGVESRDCVMVGDTYTSDIIMANQFGMESIWISRSKIDPDLTEVKRAQSLAEIFI